MAMPAPHSTANSATTHPRSTGKPHSRPPPTPRMCRTSRTSRARTALRPRRRHTPHPPQPPSMAGSSTRSPRTRTTRHSQARTGRCPSRLAGVSTSRPLPCKSGCAGRRPADRRPGQHARLPPAGHKFKTSPSFLHTPHSRPRRGVLEACRWRRGRPCSSSPRRMRPVARPTPLWMWMASLSWRTLKSRGIPPCSSPCHMTPSRLACCAAVGRAVPCCYVVVTLWCATPAPCTCSASASRAPCVAVW
mmetsp:Transcript_805/g.1869  ORF Transcript_805/g.1869 Transcript_805/m.1869 type:complete len:247 (+) Transcript_805:1-741(+)